MRILKSWTRFFVKKHKNVKIPIFQNSFKFSDVKIRTDILGVRRFGKIVFLYSFLLCLTPNKIRPSRSYQYFSQKRDSPDVSSNFNSTAKTRAAEYFGTFLTPVRSKIEFPERPYSWDMIFWNYFWQEIIPLSFRELKDF